ncbi:MAG: right-handed parallel beta-helix repeat-containing protein, partial [Cytophagales bacterium]|nr:right-handed parallel beta-helix repeat-containing protein [Cytophagales bacterium]
GGSKVKLEAKSNSSMLINRIGVPANNGLTFTWNLTGANIIPVVPSSPTVRNISYQNNGSYPFTFNGNNSYGCVQSIRDTFKVKNAYCGQCLADIDSGYYHVKDSVIAFNNIDASIFPNKKVIFDGIYKIDSDLTLQNGTFKLKPGTQLIVRNGTFIGVKNATLVLETSTITAGNTGMWSGLITYDSSSILSSGCSGQMSQISQAIYGIWNGSRYSKVELDISNTIFFNNYVSIYMQLFSANFDSKGFNFTNNIFNSDSNQFLPPYYLDKYPQAYVLLDHYNQPVVFKNNIIKNTYQGFVQYNYDILVDPNGASLTKISNNYVENAFGSGFNMYCRAQIDSNTFVLPNRPDLTKGYIRIPNQQAIGVFNSGNCIVENNTFIGSKNLTNKPSDIMMGVYGNITVSNTKIYNNSFSNLTNGIITLRELYNDPSQGVQVFGNLFRNNSNGVYLYFGPYSVNNSPAIRCNTFTDDSLIVSNGIYVHPAANLGSIGSQNSPSGNKFVGYNGASSFALYNDGNDISYYIGSDEPSVFPFSGGQGNINFQSVSTIANCSGQGYITGNGRLALTNENSELLSLSQIKDSLKHRNGSKSKLVQYQTLIIDHYEYSNRLDSLEMFAGTLVNCNREAYYTILLFLMKKYFNQGNYFQFEICKKALLAPNPEDKEIQCQIKYFELTSKKLIVNPASLPRYLMGKLSVKDSSDFAYIAQSGTSVAESAYQKLKIYCPDIMFETKFSYKINYDTLNCASTLESAKKGDVNIEVGTYSLGDAIPNPAKDEALIPYTLQDQTAIIIIEIRELVSGRLIKSINLNKDKKSYSESVRLEEFISGIYTYSLVINGNAISTKKLVVVK